MIRFILLFLLTILLSCDRNKVEVINNGSVLEKVGLVDSAEKYEFQALDDTLIVTENGVGIYIPSESFEDKDGNIIKDGVELRVKDLLKFSEMFSEQISTVSPAGLLETRGMLNVRAYHDGEEVSLVNGKGVDLFFPGDSSLYTNAEIYYGYEGANQIIEWQKGETQKQISDTIDWQGEVVLSFSFLHDYHEDLLPDSGLDADNISIFDSLRTWVDLSDSEKQQLLSTPMRVYWTLFKDGDFEVYHIEGEVPEGLKKKVRDRLNSAPPLPPFQREGGTADVSGQITLRSYVKEVQLLRNFSLRAYELGWINCDIFLRIEAPLIDMVVDAPNDKTIMKLVFDDYKTIVTGALKDNGMVYFVGVPEGASVRLITIYPDQEFAQLSVTKTTVSKRLSKISGFEKVNKAEIERRLDEELN